MGASQKDRSRADRRQQILKAAVAVFAERGFHRTRVSDIAKAAGVAYGLIYHYFDSKDAVLDALFSENWGVFMKALEEIAAGPESARTRLGAISDLMIGAITASPELIQVLIQEVSRSDRFAQPRNAEAFGRAFAIVEALIRRGQEDGALEPSIDAKVAAYLFFGGLETVCTGFLLGQIDCSNEAAANRVKETARSFLLAGLTKTKE